MLVYTYQHEGKHLKKYILTHLLYTAITEFHISIQKEMSTCDFLCCLHKSCWDRWGKVSSLPSWRCPAATDESDSRLFSTPLHDRKTERRLHLFSLHML